MNASDGAATTWRLPRLPDRDTALARRLAADLRWLSAALGAAARQADGAVDHAQRTWLGPGSRAAPVPMLEIEHGTRVLRRALDQLAEDLDRYARELDRAHESHGLSWGKIAAVATVVAVTAAAVTVTVGSGGAAAPGAAAAEAAVVGAAAGQMAAAGAAAVAAETAAVQGFALAARLAASLQLLRAVVVPRLYLAAVRAPVWVESPVGGAVVGGGTVAVTEYAETGEVAPVDVLLGALLGAGENYAAAPRDALTRTFRPRTEADIAYLREPFVRDLLVRRARATAPQDVRPFSADPGQLKDHHKHAPALGLTVNYSAAHASEFERVMRRFAEASTTVRMHGTWKSDEAILYADYDRGTVMICRPDGSFWTLLDPSPAQFWHLWHQRALGGAR